MNTWPTVRLGDVLRQRKQFIAIDDLTSYRRPRVKLHAQGIVLRDEVPGALIKTKAQQVCRVGELLVAEIDAKVGGYGVVPESLDGAIVSSHYFLFELDEFRLSRGFLDYFIRTPAFRDQVEAQGTTNYAAIRPADVLTYQIPLPPLAEQQRLVARIDLIAAIHAEALGKHHTALAETEALVAATANAVFSSHPQWPVRPLEQVATIRSGVTLGRVLKGETISLPYLRVANVQDGRLDLREIKCVQVLPSEANKWQLQAGDLLLTEGGDWDKLGRCAVWSGEVAHCIHQNHIFCVRVDLLAAEARYVAKLIGSPVGKAYFQASAKQTTNLASINQRQLRAFPVPLPSMSEQRRIVAELDALQAEVIALKAAQATRHAELNALMPAILDRAFAGAL